MRTRGITKAAVAYREKTMPHSTILNNSDEWIKQIVDNRFAIGQFTEMTNDESDQVQLFVICSVLSAHGPPKISVKDWSCGFTETHKHYTYDLLEGSCVKYKATVNLCCAKHKDCLKRCNSERFEKEAKECTADLCLCLEVPANKGDGCGYKVYESCYNALMNIKFIEVKIKEHQTDDTYESVMPYGLHEESVRNVYAECGAAQKYTTRACAVRHNECHLQGSQDCKEDFKHCMVCANTRINEDQEQSCSLAIEGLKLDASSDDSPSPMPSAADPLTPVPSETLTADVQKGCSTLAVYIPVLVSVAVACAVELLQYDVLVDEQEEREKSDLKEAVHSMTDATHLIGRPRSIIKEAPSCV